MKLTIGTFDGVHLGHQIILKSVDGVVTFSNHPQTALHHETPQTLCALPLKLSLLKRFGVHVHVLPFTYTLSQMTPEAFLLMLRNQLPFTQLILGYDAAIGNKRTGTPEHLHDLSEKHGFSLTYLDPFKFDGEIVSSSLIRRLISQGDLKQAEKLLGRPYSIFSTVQAGAGKGRAIGFCTANIALDHFCLPPTGVYAVRGVLEGKIYQGVANLGFAPTLQQRNNAILEVHLFDFAENLYGRSIEVLFDQFIRPEKTFSSVRELKEQIEQDILSVKKVNHITVLDNVISPFSP